VVWRPKGSAGAVASCDVRPDGTYELETDRAGEGTLVLFERLAEVARAEIVVEVGKSHEQDLQSVEAVACITGKISDPTGVVPADVAIVATKGDWGIGSPIAAHIAADGTYTLPVPAGPAYVVVAQRGSIRQKRERVAAGATGIDFAFPELARIELRLVDAETKAPLASRSAMQWKLSWRESGTQAFAECSAAIDVAGSCALELPVGRVDLSVELERAGYVPRVVEGLTIAAGREVVSITIELDRGATLSLRLRGERELTTGDELGHAVFLLRDDQASAVKGPFEARAATPFSLPPSANRAINNVYLWVRDPSLMHQLVELDRQGDAEVRGLARGRYTLRAFPDDFIFDPPAIEVTAPRCVAEVRWTQR